MKTRTFDGTLVARALRELVQANRELHEKPLATADPKVVRAQLVIELAAGIGRVAALVGEMNGGGRGQESVQSVAWELGGVVHDVCLLAAAFDIDLGRAAIENFNTVNACSGASQRFESFAPDPK